MAGEPVRFDLALQGGLVATSVRKFSGTIACDADCERVFSDDGGFVKILVPHVGLGSEFFISRTVGLDLSSDVEFLRYGNEGHVFVFSTFGIGAVVHFDRRAS